MSDPTAAAQRPAEKDSAEQRSPLEVVEKLESLLSQMENKLNDFSRNSSDKFGAIEQRLEKMGDNLKEMERLSEVVDNTNSPSKSTTA
ncbi:hypothetical protein H4R33_006860 [Dimargaris cristalligena]|nr:hypothetical protein H4R33_006860 [Dimargaris cristalligena]